MRRGVRMKGIKVIRKPDGRRYVYKRTPTGLVKLPDLPENDPRFLAAYAAAEPPPRQSAAPQGSIADLCARYLASPDYRALAPSTRAVWRRLVDKISIQRGKGLVKDLRPGHLRKDVRALSPGAASNRLKAWRSLMKFAVDEGWIETNPAIDVSAPRGDVTPHRAWSADERAAFRAFWQIGTPERLAFEVLHWTAARCIDAVTLGWQMVDRSGWITFTQAKTRQPVALPITAPLPLWAAPFEPDRAMLLACLPSDRMQWIVTVHGKPRSHKAMSQWFSRAASKAGLPDDCTAHGLRKARAAALAEIGVSPHQIGAWIGDVSLAMVSHYTRSADRRAILTGPEQERNLGNRVEKFPKLPE